MMQLIGIAGGSCSGKSYICEKLRKKISSSNCEIIPMDAYYRNLSHIAFNDRLAINFDDPHAIDKDLLLEHLSVLIAGKTISMPEYDFTTHTRKPTSRIINAGASVIIVEGLFTLFWRELRDLFVLKVFMELDWGTCLKRRSERDVLERGRSRESVEAQFRETVFPMYKRYIEPTRHYADMVIQGDSTISESVDRLHSAFLFGSLAKNGKG